MRLFQHEKDILMCRCEQGLNRKQTAEALFIEDSSVQTRIRRMLKRLDLPPHQAGMDHLCYLWGRHRVLSAISALTQTDGIS
jgi:uncharacterized protein with PIN domain